MPEQLQKILDRVLEWWKKFNTKQRTLLISIAAVVLLALGILAAVVTKPQMKSLVVCETTSQASEVKDLLVGEGIDYEVSEDGLEFSVAVEDLPDAEMLLGAEGIPTEGYSLDNVFDGGFSSTEADKNKKYKLYLESYIAERLEGLANVEKATVGLDLPNEDGTILKKDEQAYAAVILTLSGEMDEEQAAGIARYIATNLGNDDTANITILDSSSNVLFSGDDSNSVTGSASTQLALKVKAENLVKSNIKDVLVGSSIYDNVEIAMNLDMNFDQKEVTTHEYYAPDGRENGMIDSQSTYESTAQGGSAATPGTDSNDDTTYVIEDSEITLSTIEEVTTDYVNNEEITKYVQSIGKVDCSNSSIAIVATNWVVHDEDTLRAAGALDDMTFEEYVAANSEPVKKEIDEEYYTMVSNATGFPVENITIIAYDEPMFQYSSVKEKTIADYFQIIVAVLIFLLLGYVVFRSTRKDRIEEPEPELSVESLLESTKESQDSLADIGFNEKSETRVLIEKFVEENPEAAAQLLRNWLNDEWE